MQSTIGISADNTSRAPIDEVARFWQDGYLGPLDGSVPEPIIDRAAAILDDMIDRRAPHPLYVRYSVRDWHLVAPEVLALFTDPAITRRLIPLLGEDLTLWRTKIFHKRPGDAALGWHQEWGAYNGEEIGNDVPSLRPAPAAADGIWNLTVWIALHDIDDELGPIRFARGSNRRRFPIAMAPMTQSEFWHDPTLGVSDPQVLVRRARECSLVLDMDTSTLFDGVDTDTLTLESARTRILNAMSQYVAAATLEFNEAEHDIVSLPVRKGQFIIFTERTMHGSSANRSSRRRLAINGRVTRADTLIYPGRLTGNMIDGANLDISRHDCILLHGRDPIPGQNKYRSAGPR